MKHVMAAALLVLGACSSSSPASKSPEAKAPEWELKGTRIIGCCCSAPCPCRINRLPQHCHGCDGTTAVHIERGHLGPVRMDGLDWVITNRGFAEDKKENWVYCYISDKATDDQFNAVKGMMEQSVKDLGAKAETLIGRIVGFRRVPIRYEISADRREQSVTIPGILEFRTKAIVLPGHKEPVKSTGIFDDFGDYLIHADAPVHKYSDKEAGYSFDLSGRQSNQADFVINPDRMAKGAIGWGCYSGAPSGGKYQEKDSGHK